MAETAAKCKHSLHWIQIRTDNTGASPVLALYSADTPSVRATPAMACTKLPRRPSAWRVRIVSMGYTDMRATMPAGRATCRGGEGAGLGRWHAQGHCAGTISRATPGHHSVGSMVAQSAA